MPHPARNCRAAAPDRRIHVRSDPHLHRMREGVWSTMTDPTERQRQQEAIRALQQERAAELRAQAEKDAKRAIDGATGQNKAARSRGAYDSAERRRALAAHLVKIGADPELAAIRMLLEVSKPPPEPPPH